MYLIYGLVNNRKAGNTKPPVWYTTGIKELKNLLKYEPKAFGQSRSFVNDALTFTEQTSVRKEQEFKTSNLLIAILPLLRLLYLNWLLLDFELRLLHFSKVQRGLLKGLLTK